MDAQRPILSVSSLLSLRHPTPSRLLVNDSLAQLEPCQNYEWKREWELYSLSNVKQVLAGKKDNLLIFFTAMADYEGKTGSVTGKESRKRCRAPPGLQARRHTMCCPSGAKRHMTALCRW